MASYSRMPVGATPGKIVLVVILTFSLAISVFQQFGGPTTDTTDNPTATRPPTPRPVRKTPAPKAGKKEQTETPSREAVPVTVSLALEHDPFATSASLRKKLGLESDRQAAATKQELIEKEQRDLAARAEEEQRRKARLAALNAERLRVLAELKRQGLTMIVGSPGELMALIGDRTIRRGDILQGFRVVEVSRDGLVLEPVEMP